MILLRNDLCVYFMAFFIETDPTNGLLIRYSQVASLCLVSAYAGWKTASAKVIKANNGTVSTGVSMS